MLIHPTTDRLRTLCLRAMAEAYVAQRQDQATLAMDFDARLALLVDAEILSRENRKLTRYLAGPGGWAPIRRCWGGSRASTA